MTARRKHLLLVLAGFALVALSLGFLVPTALGAPGLGSTYLAERLAGQLMGTGDVAAAGTDAYRVQANDPSNTFAVGNGFVGATDEGEPLVFTITGESTVSVGGTVVEGEYPNERTVMARSIDYSYAGVLSIPERVSYLGRRFDVTGVRANAFASYYATGGSKVTCMISGVNVPGSVEFIDQRAFYECMNLRMVTFEGEPRITSIGTSAFYGCTALPAITLPASLTGLGQSAFERASRLSDVTFEGEGVTSLPSRCFAYSGVRSLDFLAGSIGSLGSYCFMGSSLASATVPAHVSSLGTGVFRACMSLERSTFADGSPIVEIPDETFMECRGLKSYEFLPQIASIELDSFRASGLTSLDVPATLTYLGEGAFRECGDLKSVTFGEGHGLLGLSASVFRDCTALPALSVPDSVRSFDASALSGCTALSAFTMPTGLESLGAFALADCTALRSVVFQADAQYVTSASSTFYHDDALASVVFYGKRNDSLMFPSSIPTFYLTVSYYASKAAVGVSALSRFCVADGAVPGEASGTDVFEGEFLPEPSEGTMWAVEPGFSFSRGMEDSFYAYVADVTGELSVGDHFAAETVERCSVTYTVEVLPEDGQPGRVTAGYGSVLLPEPAIDADQTGAVTLPERVVAPDGRTYVVDAISAYAFSGCARFIAVTIPATVQSIGERAFARASALRNVSFEGDASMLLDRGVFLGCANIRLVVFGDKKANVAFGISSPDVYYTVRYYKSAADKEAGRLQSSAVVREGSRLGSLAASSVYRGAVPRLSVGYEWEYEPGFGANTPLADSCWVFARGIGFQADITVRNGNVRTTACWFKVIDYDEEAGVGTCQVGVGRDGLTAVHTSVKGTPVIPASVQDDEGKTYRVVAVGPYAFGSEDYTQSCAYVESVTLATSVTAIAADAFKNMPALDTITLPSSIAAMGERAFSGCEKLRTARFTTSAPLAVLPASAFEDCWRLTSVTLPSKLNEIGPRAFAGCYRMVDDVPYGLATIAFPASVTVIGESAFAGDANLASVALPVNIRRIGASAFSGCRSVGTIRFNGDARSVTFGTGAFNLNGSSLKNVIFMDKKSETFGDYTDAGGYQVYYNIRFYENNAAYESGRLLDSLLIRDDVAAVYWQESEADPSDSKVRIENHLSGTLPSLGEGSTWRCEDGFAVDKRTSDSYWAIGGWDLSHATVTLDQTEFFYTGQAIKPVPTVTWPSTGAVLVEGRDWELDPTKGLAKDGYGNNRRGPVGIVYLRGIGDYAGTLRALFNISLQVDSANSFTATLVGDGSFTYDATAHTPAVAVQATLLGDPYPAVAGRDYTVEYADNVDAGTGYAVVRGGNLFGGVFRYPFEIAPADLRECTALFSDARLDDGSVEVGVSVEAPWGAALAEGTDFTVDPVVDEGGQAATVYVEGTGNWSGVLSYRVHADADDGGETAEPENGGEPVESVEPDESENSDIPEKPGSPEKPEVPEDEVDGALENEEGDVEEEPKGGNGAGDGSGDGIGSGAGQGAGSGDGTGSGSGDGASTGSGRGDGRDVGSGGDSPDGTRNGKAASPLTGDADAPSGQMSAKDAAKVPGRLEIAPQGGKSSGGSYDPQVEAREPETGQAFEDFLEPRRSLPRIFEMADATEEAPQALEVALTLVQAIGLSALAVGALCFGIGWRVRQYGKEK